ncbi:hypothetical protein C3Y92_15300 [Solidesulfovibrio carbinolicus]|uniref:Uncharacterized protein n=2 Tax=Solidesulfovibrio carbinolicus TaxID=296842 RepID=A0A4P6HQR0_9BACT|nr:hypothetical protein C3Y92_15300 [Solidesulfovibrio carbinolicus]
MIRVLAMADATADTPAARRARRRFLARRRCLRALRRTLAFIVVVTPFCYFGFLICCHMPPEWQRGLPNLILLYEWWMFFRNAFTLLRNIWFTPLLAVLPLLVNVVFVVAYPPGQAWKIRRDTYFNQFLDDRLAVIKHIENGDFPGFTPREGYVALPEAYAHTSISRGCVSYTRGDNGYTIFFYTSWNVLETYQGLEFDNKYSKDDPPPQENNKYIEFMAPQWYYLEY